MKYTLNSLRENKITYAQQEAEKTTDSHEYVFNKIIERLNAPQSEIKRFKEKFRTLKKIRVKSDYTEQQFSVLECLDCKDLANYLKSTLQRFFNSQTA